MTPPTTGTLVELDALLKLLGDPVGDEVISLTRTIEAVKSLPTFCIPEIGKEYEFSDNEVNWGTGDFGGYVDTRGNGYKHIRPISKSPDILALEKEAERLGFILTKK